MLRTLKNCILLTAAASLFLCHSLAAEEGIKRNLVSVNWLERHLNNTDVLILDASPKQVYTAQHIPGAINADLYTYGIQEEPPAEMEERFQSWGISHGKKIVIYDQGGSMMATRTFFDLYYYGFPANDLLILDGGFYKWQQEGFPVTSEITPAPAKGTFKVKKLNEDIRVKLPEFLTASGDTENNVLIDALSPNWHFGEVQAFDRAGHIPNSIMLSNTDFYNQDKTFKSPEEIKKMLVYMGVRAGQQIYTYCGGGVAASVPFFALKVLLGYPKVKLYKESEMGWLQDERGLPYWTFDAPFLMREASWLQSWGGKIMRTYAASKISIVDVRTAEEYRQGHVPFALNVPASLFTENISNPGKLAELLGAAGVDNSHEAVIISGEGLNKEAALAFVMLKKLGQRKISVLMDSMDKWVKLGFAVTKDESAAGGKTSGDLSVNPTNYPKNFRKDIIIDSPDDTKGLFPKVFIASGKNATANGQGDKAVHIPYTDLLNADGTPKAAKDIWNILNKAGVPRYAELVCSSDDPAEAAVNYYILKLMGFPDVKVFAN